MYNCPNCSAPINSHRCEYCGTVFEEPAGITLYADNIPITTLYYDDIEEIRSYAETAPKRRVLL